MFSELESVIWVGLGEESSYCLEWFGFFVCFSLFVFFYYRFRFSYFLEVFIFCIIGLDFGGYRYDLIIFVLNR